MCDIMMSGNVEQRIEQGIRRGTPLNERPNKDLKTNHRRIELYSDNIVNSFIMLGKLIFLHKIYFNISYLIIWKKIIIIKKVHIYVVFLYHFSKPSILLYAIIHLNFRVCFIKHSNNMTRQTLLFFFWGILSSISVVFTYGNIYVIYLI